MKEKKKLQSDIWLDQISGFSPRIKCALAEKFFGSEQLRWAGADEVRRACEKMGMRRLPQKRSWREMLNPSLDAAEKQLAVMKKRGIGCLAADDDDYPKQLLQISDPPWMLYYRGNISCLKKPVISVVGARESTEYGRWAAYHISRNLAEAGFLVVSGMARGIDTEAHRGALACKNAEMATAAVFGCGVDVCYPKSAGRIMEQILTRGVVLSEYPPGTQALPYRFPQRNRIISGLSQGIVVVEAGLKSGSLITAALAAEQGRDVYAVPGNINRLASVGTNMLIRDGAIPLISPEDILFHMGIETEKITKTTQNLLGIDEQRVYDEVRRRGEIQLSDLACSLSLSAGETAALVTILEMKGILCSRLGKIFIAK